METNEAPKEALREQILATGADHLYVAFWFDTLYERHLKNPSFTEEDIFRMLTSPGVLQSEEEASRVFMDALTASDEQHRRAMRGATPELAALKLERTYGLTKEQAIRAQKLRDEEGMTEDESVAAVRLA